MVDGLADLLRVPLANPIYTLIAFVVLRLAYNKFQPGVWRIPGPTAAAYTKLWRVYDVYNGTAHLTAIELHRKHGALVRIGPNHVSVSDPDFISQFYSIREDYTKTGFYPIQSISWKKKPEMNLFSTRDPEEHRLSKRQIGAAYSLPNLLQSETAIDSCIDLFMSRLRELINTNSSVDLGAWLQYFAFDVVGEVTFATKLGFLEKGTDVDVLVFTLKAINSRASIKRDGELIAADTEGRDMLSRWAYVKSSDPDKMSTRDIVVHLSTNVFAGSDTTAITLRAIVYFLCRHPKVAAKMIAEIDNADAAHKLSTPISYKEASTLLLYLDAVVREAMRLHPSVGALMLSWHIPNVRGVSRITGSYSRRVSTAS